MKASVALATPESRGFAPLVGTLGMTASTVDFGKRHVIRAGLWTLGGYSASMGLRLVSSLVMTRLLAPEMFGLMALAMVMIQGVSMISDVGLQQIAVQSKGYNEEGFRTSLWSVQVVRGVLISLCLALLALALMTARPDGVTASAPSVYLHPSFPPALMLLALLPLLQGLEPMGLLGALRNMKTQVLVTLELTTQLVGLACMIAFAQYRADVWALVVGTLCAAVFRIGLAYALFPRPAPRFRLDRAHWAEILSFGKWITLSSVIGFAALSADRLVLGLLVPPALLGFYSIAHLLVSSLDQCLTKVISSVAFPVLSDAQRTRPERLREIYYRMHVPISVGVWFAAWFSFAAAPLVVAVLYDPRYAQTAQVLSLLSLTLLSGPVRVSLQLLLSFGDSKTTATAAGLRAIVSLAAIWVLYPLMGLRGVALAAVIGSVVVIPVVYRVLWSRKMFDWKRELWVLPAGASGLALGYGAAQFTPYFQRLGY